jgi:uncharacterized protein (DUF2141 family)
MTTKLRLFLATLGLAAAGTSAAAADLAVTFDIEEPRGQLMVALYATEADYDLNRPQVAEVASASAKGPLTVTFKNLAPGRYAVKSFHDVNGDGKMSQNPFGRPTEPFGFSNNAPVRMGAPSWAEAAFEVGPDGAQQRISFQ